MRIEAFIVGVLCFSGLIALGKSFGVAVFTGIVVSAILPWLMGLIPAFAWIAAIVFSLVWATLGYISISKYLMNSIDKIKENVANSSNAVQPITGLRCSSCGTSFDVEVNFCGTCGVRQSEGA